MSKCAYVSSTKSASKTCLYSAHHGRISCPCHRPNRQVPLKTTTKYQSDAATSSKHSTLSQKCHKGYTMNTTLKTLDHTYLRCLVHCLLKTDSAPAVQMQMLVIQKYLISPADAHHQMHQQL